jgi:uncharacterized protein
MVQFVVKTSKFCNLRCRYCYEYPELGNRQAILPEQLEVMYHHIADYYQKFDQPTYIDFVWHGGEPLLQKPEFYWKTFERQKEIFGELAPYIKNSVQTNLTVLNTERINLLKNGFDSVGVSIDLFGGLRVDGSGTDSVFTVLNNLDKLRDAQIPYGCITVLTQLNLPYLKEIYQFYEQMGVSFRLLPLFKGAFDNQHKGFEITAQEVLEAFCKLVDFWLESEDIVMVKPIVEHIEQILRHYTPHAQPIFYDKRERESVYLVNTNGDVYSYADAYEGLSHGNIFTTSLAELVAGEAHQKVIEQAESRMAGTCSQCPYFGSCSGYPVAEGSLEYNEFDETGAIRCIVTQGTLQHIEKRFKQVGIISVETGKLTLDTISFGKTPAALDCPV